MENKPLIQVEETVSPLTKETVEEDLSKGKEVSKIKTQENSLTLVEDSFLHVIEEIPLNEKGYSSEEIENFYTDLQELSEKNKQLEVCISRGENLKQEDIILTKKYSHFEKIKNNFIEHGEEHAGSDEEWLKMAKLIKKELDAQLRNRIEWEKQNEDFSKDCLEK